MTQLANKFNAINLSQGFPDFNCSTELIELVNYYMQQGANQYAPMPGVLKLREAISNKIELCYNKLYDVNDEITVTAGATQALFTAITAFVHKDDEVIVFEPAYDSYIPSIQLNCGKVIPIRLNENDFSIPWNLVRKSITTQTKMIIINSPHNPTGAILNDDDIRELINIVSKNEILILSDEVYEHIVFDNDLHRSISAYPELSERAIVVSSFGKTFHTTGWKIGYVAAPKQLTQEFRKIHQFNVFSVNCPIQNAYADYLKDKKVYEDLSGFYQSKRDLFVGLIKNSKFKLLPCSGTYFQLLDYSEISEADDNTFAEELVENAGVAVIPLSPFYTGLNDSKIIRICFAKTDEVLVEGSSRLINYFAYSNNL